MLKNGFAHNWKLKTVRYSLKSWVKNWLSKFLNNAVNSGEIKFHRKALQLFSTTGQENGKFLYDLRYLALISCRFCNFYRKLCNFTAFAGMLTKNIHTQDEVRDPRQVLARPTWVADREVRCDRPQWSGKNLGRAFRLANGNFSLFGLANTHISVCSVWPIPIFRSVRSGQYPYFGLFGLANTQISACSVWPIPKFRSVRSGQYPYFGLFGLANTHISVCSVWPIPIFLSVRSGHYPFFGLFGLANT